MLENKELTVSINQITTQIQETEKYNVTPERTNYTKIKRTNYSHYILIHQNPLLLPVRSISLMFLHISEQQEFIILRFSRQDAPKTVSSFMNTLLEISEMMESVASLQL
jgi:hypothetical protein